MWDKNPKVEQDGDVEVQDKAYTYEKLIVSPTYLTDKDAFKRIRGY